MSEYLGQLPCRIVADNILIFCVLVSEKIRLDIPCVSSSRQVIHVMSSLVSAVVICTLHSIKFLHRVCVVGGGVQHKGIIIFFISKFSMKTCCEYSLETPHQALLMSTHNICCCFFHGEIRKNMVRCLFKPKSIDIFLISPQKTYVVGTH